MRRSISIASVITELRRSRCLTGPELAKRSGMSRGHLFHIEHETFAPSLRTLEKLSVGLGVGLGRLLALSAADSNTFVFEDSFSRQVKPFLRLLNDQQKQRVLKTLQAAP